MPEEDHANVIEPPGLTVMRISGGRYRVTGAHWVVWRWMNKFSPASLFAVPSAKPDGRTEGGDKSEVQENDDDNEPDTDFDFGDLVTMTIIDVFETDTNGRLLSHCPTFDNRAVHKTQEVAERLRKGASNFKERMEVVARSPVGKSVNKAAGNFGKMSISIAWVVGNIVKSKIEEEIHKHQHPSEQQQLNDVHGEAALEDEDASLDHAVGGEDVADESSSIGNKDAVGNVANASSKGEGYFSDESSAASPRWVINTV